MRLFQTDLDGNYTGESLADEDPLEPGRFLIPAGCVEVPPPPIPFGQKAVWQAGAWSLVTLTLGEANPSPTLPPTPAQLLEVARAQAALDRGSFCKALKAGGIMSAAEAVEAAKGNWPASFAQALAAMSGIDPDDAQIDWAVAASVRRLHPLFLAILAWYAAATGLSAEKAEALGDQIFAIQPAPTQA